jgi:hypothetical protein
MAQRKKIGPIITTGTGPGRVAIHSSAAKHTSQTMTIFRSLKADRFQAGAVSRPDHRHENL